MHRDKTQIFKKIPSDKMNGTKNAVCFLSRTSTHHSFIFNLGFLYKLKYKAHLSKTVCGIFDFWFRFVFIKAYFFVWRNAWIIWLWNVIIPFRIKSIENPQTVLLPGLWFLSRNKKFQNLWYLCELELPKLTWWKIFET